MKEVQDWLLYLKGGISESWSQKSSLRHSGGVLYIFGIIWDRGSMLGYMSNVHNSSPKIHAASS